MEKLAISRDDVRESREALQKGFRRKVYKSSLGESYVHKANAKLSSPAHGRTLPLTLQREK